MSWRLIWRVRRLLFSGVHDTSPRERPVASYLTLHIGRTTVSSQVELNERRASSSTHELHDRAFLIWWQLPVCGSTTRFCRIEHPFCILTVQRVETAVDCVGTLYPDLFQDKIVKRAHRGSLRDCLRCLVPTPPADSFLEDLSVLLPSLLSHYKMALQPIAAG